MNRIINWFAANGVAANLLMVFIVAMGFFSISNIKLEVFPEFATDIIQIAIPYPGAAPEEAEEGVVVRVEEAIQDLEGIDDIRSTAAENMGQVSVFLVQGVDGQKLLNDIKARVDAIDSFPDEAEEPVIEEIIRRTQVIEVAVSGPAEEWTLKRLGERVRDDLSALPEISQVELVAARPYEISIEVSEETLRRYGLSFKQVAEAVRSSSLDLPGGRLRSRSGEILLRTEGQAYRGREFEVIPLLTLPNGTRLLVGDVAKVIDGFADSDQQARFDGQPAVLVQVYRVGDQSALEVAAAVKDYIREAQPRMPDGIQLSTWKDDTVVLRSRLELLTRNGLAGFALVLLVLALFLKLRLAGWVALGIPISFLGAAALMPFFDVSVNLISLFAFIVVLGIVVDDAIIVGENIYTRYQAGDEGLAAAVPGAQRVSTPVIFAVLTSVAAFAPLLAVTGNIGKIMRVVPVIVICTLVFSLIESLLILPNHLSHLHRRGTSPGFWTRVQRRVSAGLGWLIERSYQPTLRRAIEWRYLTLSVGLAALLLSFAVVRGGWVKFNFLPPIEADNAAAMVTMAQGTPTDVTAEVVRRMEREALALQRELEETTGESSIVHLQASVGEQPFRTRQSRQAAGAGRNFGGSHLGEVTMELTPSEERTLSSTEIANRWRERVGAVPDAVELSFTSSLFSAGEAINIELTGPDIDELRSISARLKTELASYPGVQDVADSFRIGKRELELRITPEAELAGLTQKDLARQVRQAFYGEEAQRIQRGRDEVKVMVRFPENERRSLGDLEEFRIRLPGGVEVPFTTAATASLSRGPASISRTNRQRVINVTADVDLDKGNTGEILADLGASVVPEILADHPSVRFSFEGQQEDQRKTLSDLKRGFLVSLLVIYALLAIPFKSYLQPLIVMSAIPFGLIGAIWGHLLMGKDMAILSIFGIVALTGVVVNDSLVMVDFINRSYRGGVRLQEALERAGSARFRPILLTSLTTFAGLTPLLLEKSLQAQFLIPMAISLAFGVLFATFITLLMVPVLYTVLEDFRALASRRFTPTPFDDPQPTAS
ncbi:MAG: efflux RND transporter permease subunit [Acidobacteriota bacterium]|nr:efflux RND transporter permease subunit [Acidobacteriota bacterium]